MLKETFLDKVRELVIKIVWSLFLSLVKMTESQYISTILRENIQREGDVINLDGHFYKELSDTEHVSHVWGAG